MLWLALALILVLQIFLRLPFLLEPLERDEGFYGYMGQRILAGEIPYRDVFDHKPPVVYYIYAAIGGSSIFPLRVFTLLYSLLTTAAVFGAGFLLLGSSGGLLSAFLYALFSGGPLIQGASSNSETFMVLPLVLALICFLLAGKKNSLALYFLAGLLSGLAFMIKQVAIFNLLVFVFWEPKKEPRVLLAGSLLLSGFLTVPAFFIIYFWLNGAGGDFSNCVFFVNQIYLKSSPVPFFFLDPRYGWHIIWALIMNENGILWLLSLVSLFIICIKDRSREMLLVAFWGLASFLGVTAGTLFFGHYFIQVIPAFCVLSAFALIRIKETVARIIVLILIGFIFILNLGFQLPFYFKYNPYQINEMKYGTNAFGVAHFAALDLSAKIKQSDDIFVWAAEPEVYFYLNKKAPSRYSYYFGWMTELKANEQIFGDLKNKNPKYILWTNYAPAFPELENWVKGNYTLSEMYFSWKLLVRKNNG